MAADSHLAVTGGHPSALAAREGSQGTLPDLSLPREAAMGDQPNALAASGGSQGTLPDALPASGGGNGGRQSSGRRWKPTQRSGRQWRRQWRPTIIWPSTKAILRLWLPVEAARALYLISRCHSRQQWATSPTLWLPVEAARALYLMLWPPVEAAMAADTHLAVAGGQPSRSGCQWRQPGHPT